MFDASTIIAIVLAMATVIGALYGARQQAASALSSTSEAAKKWREPLEAEIAELKRESRKLAQRIDAQDDELRELRWGVTLLIRQLVDAGMVPIWTPREGQDR